MGSVDNSDLGDSGARRTAQPREMRADPAIPNATSQPAVDKRLEKNRRDTTLLPFGGGWCRQADDQPGDWTH